MKTPAKYKMNLAEFNTPDSYAEAASGVNKEKWIKAIQETKSPRRKSDLGDCSTRKLEEDNRFEMGFQDHTGC